MVGEVGQEHGIEVVELIDGSPAQLAGIKPGDILIAGDGEPLATAKDLQAQMTGDLVGEDFEITLIRRGQLHNITTRPVELTEN
jgi:S1-C subfamily serine protease